VAITYFNQLKMEVAGKRLDDDTELCEPCQEGNMSTQADGYCNDCGENMCQACFQSHVKMRLGRNHVLGAVVAGRKQGTQSSSEKCKKHTSEFIKYYCRNHDFVGCGHCLLFDHRKCEPELINDIAKNLTESSDFKNILKELNELESLKTEVEASLEKNRNGNTGYHEKAIQGIQKHRAEINTWLDNLTSKIEAEEIQIWKENETVLSKLEDWIKIISDMIDKVRDEINTEKYTGENLFIRMIECRSEVSEFATKSVQEIKSNLDIKHFAFGPIQKLCVFTKSANLGIIRLGNGTTELQIDQRERQTSSNLTGNAQKCLYFYERKCNGYVHLVANKVTE
jgi:hypothetical protein